MIMWVIVCGNVSMGCRSATATRRVELQALFGGTPGHM